MEKFDVLNLNGEFTGNVATREECHKNGLWHRAVYGFIFNKNGDVLLQKRSKTKKLWPNLWDVTAGGHVLAGEFGDEALIREIKEELGVEVSADEIKYLVGSSSTNISGDIINNHFNECYIVTKNIDETKIKLQEEEVSEIKWFTKEEILNRIENNYDGITNKTGAWNFLKKYYERFKENIGRINLLENVKVLCHSSIKINKGKTIYFDPFKVDTNYNDADIIFITHNHYDHYSEEDIQKIVKYNTVFVVPESLKNNLLDLGIKEEYINIVAPNKEYIVENIKVETVPAYNTNKHFHPKENNWVGYIIDLEGIRYYIAGDTDITEESKQVKCDVALIPIGGTYTMNYIEATELINEIKPKIVVPTHYGSIVGTKQDSIEFSKLLKPEIECKILIS